MHIERLVLVFECSELRSKLEKREMFCQVTYQSLSLQLQLRYRNSKDARFQQLFECFLFHTFLRDGLLTLRCSEDVVANIKLLRT